MTAFETVIPAHCEWPQTMPCACGNGAYYWDDGDGWVPDGRVIDDNSDGHTAIDCQECGREFVPGPPRRLYLEGGAP